MTKRINKPMKTEVTLKLVVRGGLYKGMAKWHIRKLLLMQGWKITKDFDNNTCSSLHATHKNWRKEFNNTETKITVEKKS